jgi:hypothetical protein
LEHGAEYRVSADWLCIVPFLFHRQ